MNKTTEMNLKAERKNALKGITELLKVIPTLNEKKDLVDYVFSGVMKAYTADLRNYIVSIPKSSISMFVDTYYDIQKLRIASGARAHKPNFKDDPKDKPNRETAKQKLHRLGYDDPEIESKLAYLRLPCDYLQTIENYIKSLLDVYTDAFEITRWAKSITGIGPVIAAGLYSKLDINKSDTTGGFLKYAGWTGAPDEVRVHGKKINYNPSLKTLFWKIGCSFQKVSNREDAIFGVWYKYFKQMYICNNAEGKYKETADQIKKKLETAKDQSNGKGKNSEAYKVACQGILNDYHLDCRARRTAVARFISVFHDKWYQMEKGQSAPNPYVQDIMGHKDIIIGDVVDLVTAKKMPNPLLEMLYHENKRAERLGCRVIRFGESSTPKNADEQKVADVESDELRDDID